MIIIWKDTFMLAEFFRGTQFAKGYYEFGSDL